MKSNKQKKKIHNSIWTFSLFIIIKHLIFFCSLQFHAMKTHYALLWLNFWRYLVCCTFEEKIFPSIRIVSCRFISFRFVSYQHFNSNKSSLERFRCNNNFFMVFYLFYRLNCVLNHFYYAYLVEMRRNVKHQICYSCRLRTLRTHFHWLRAKCVRILYSVCFCLYLDVFFVQYSNMILLHAALLFTLSVKYTLAIWRFYDEFTPKSGNVFSTSTHKIGLFNGTIEIFSRLGTMWTKNNTKTALSSPAFKSKSESEHNVQCLDVDDVLF